MNFITKILFSAFFILLITISLKAQIGVNLRYSLPQIESDKDYINNSIIFGADYWFRLKKKRIEFMPELSYEVYSLKENLTNSKLTSINFAFKTNAYLLNLGDDCNCPTFSKEGNTISKGFYVSIAPEIKFRNFKSDASENQTLLGGILGVGVDIGVADLITISPNIGYEIVALLGDQPIETNSSYRSLQIGLRVGLRFDNKNKFGRRR